jgi:hypothetical protein
VGIVVPMAAHAAGTKLFLVQGLRVTTLALDRPMAVEQGIPGVLVVAEG